MDSGGRAAPRKPLPSSHQLVRDTGEVEDRNRLVKFVLLGTALSGVMIALNYFASATAIVRHPALAIPLGLLAGFGGAAGLLASPWGESSK